MSNPLPDHNILALAKLKIFTDDKINAVQMMINLSDRVGNLVWKGEIAVFSFSLSF